MLGGRGWQVCCLARSTGRIYLAVRSTKTENSCVERSPETEKKAGTQRFSRRVPRKVYGSGFLAVKYSAAFRARSSRAGGQTGI